MCSIVIYHVADTDHNYIIHWLLANYVLSINNLHHVLLWTTWAEQYFPVWACLDRDFDDLYTTDPLLVSGPKPLYALKVFIWTQTKTTCSLMSSKNLIFTRKVSIKVHSSEIRQKFIPLNHCSDLLQTCFLESSFVILSLVTFLVFPIFPCLKSYKWKETTLGINTKIDYAVNCPGVFSSTSDNRPYLA